jgi:hypothetical protein
MRRGLATLAMAPLLAWSLSPLGAAAPALCHILLEMNEGHACCAMHAEGAAHHPAEAGPAIETAPAAGMACHAAPDVTAAPTAAHGSTAGGGVMVAGEDAACACVPMEESRRADAREAAIALDTSKPRQVFSPVAAVLAHPALDAGARDGVLKLPGVDRPIAGGTPLFLLFDVLLI